MKSCDELRRENDALREHISRLSGAILREVVDSARALTGARYGVIATRGSSSNDSRRVIFESAPPAGW